MGTLRHVIIQLCETELPSPNRIILINNMSCQLLLGTTWLQPDQPLLWGQLGNLASMWPTKPVLTFLLWFPLCPGSSHQLILSSGRENELDWLIPLCILANNQIQSKSLIKCDFQLRGGVDMRDNYGSAGEERVSFFLFLVRTALKLFSLVAF